MPRATYYDGLSAAAHDVEISVHTGGLHIAGSSGQPNVVWQINRIFSVKANYRSQPVRLGCHDDGEARLVIEDPGAVAYLKQHLPSRLFRQGSFLKTMGFAAVFAAVTFGFLAAVYYTIPLLAEPIAQAIPAETEKHLGASVFEDVLQRWPECIADETEATDGREALHHVMSVLTAGTPLEDQVTVTMVRAGMENAFALPGGYVIVTGQLLHAMTGPDELAAVLAHEFGHVAYRHSMVSLTRYLGTAFVVQLLTGGGTGSSQWIVVAGSELANVSYSREFEREADGYAIERLLATKIGTRGMAAFFERLAEHEEESAGSYRTVQSFVRTHPFSDERAEAARQAASKETQPILSDAQWQALKALCPQPESDDADAGSN